MLVPTETTQTTARSGVKILALVAAVGLLYYGRVFFITVAIASMIAMLLNPLVGIFMKARLPRGLASFLVCSLALIFIYLVGVGIYTQSLAIIDDLPTYADRVNELVDNAASRVDRIRDGFTRMLPKRFQDETASRPAPAAARGKKPANTATTPIQDVRIHEEPTVILTNLSAYLDSVYSTVLMASFVPFLVYFLLSWSDHLRTRFLYLFDGEDRDAAEHAWTGVGAMVRAYVVGNFMLGVLLSVASSILFASVKLPYWMIVGPLSGFLSLVPYIGLPLAMIPPMFAALPAGREPTLYLFLAASVALLHLFALNLLYPKFVGSRVHLNPLVVTVALMFWGILWGGIGLLLAIPLTAALKAVCDNVASMRPYGRLLGD